MAKDPTTFHGLALSVSPPLLAASADPSFGKTDPATGRIRLIAVGNQWQALH